MPQVHIHRVRFGVSRESVASTIQQYTGMGMIEARQAAEDAVSGKATSIYIDDFTAVYELADMLTDLGVEAEADESDY
jgi:DNA-binding FadR family transcriptional regulator